MGRDGNVTAAWGRLNELVSMNPRIAQWISVVRRPLYTSSIYITATSMINAASGFVFWVVAARLFVPEDIGLGSALVSAVTFLLLVSSLGLETSIMKYLPNALSDSSALTNSFLTVSSLAGLATVVIFLASVSVWSPALAFVRESPLYILVFLGVVVAAANCNVIDYTFVVLRRANLSFARNLIQALLKLLLLVALAPLFGHAFGIFASWGIATLMSVVVALWLFLRKALPGYRPQFILGRHIGADMLRFSIASYLASSLFNVPMMLIPILVVNVLGSQANAYSYVSWGAAAPLLAISAAVATSLFAEGSHTSESLASNVIRSFKMVSFLLLPAELVILVGGDRLLLIFGRNYSQEATIVLRVLAVSAVPVAVSEIFLGIARVQHRLKALVLVPAAMAIGTLVLSAALVRPLGILGPAVAWFAVQSAIALVVLPSILKTVTSRQDVSITVQSS